MYRYKCTAAVNAGKQNFYDVTEQLKALYPDLTENVGTRSDNEFLRREFVRGKSRVMVQYSFSEQSVTVYSEEWLGKYYGERQVLEGRFPLRGTATTGTMWAMSGIYFAVMAVVTIAINILDAATGFFIDDTQIEVISILIMTAVYTLSGIIIRQRTSIPFMKLIFCQAGGFISVCVMLVLANMFILTFYLEDWFYWLYMFTLPFLIYSFAFVITFLPALEISFLLQGAAGLIMKKIYSSKTAKGEDIEQTD